MERYLNKRATSRSRCSATPTATPSTSVPAIARPNAATRSSSKRPPRRYPRRHHRADGPGSRGRRQGLRLHQRRHRRVPLRRRRLLLPRDEHPASGGHPATELITGVDLVEQQLRVAAGEPLPFTQDEVEIRGHAIEIRINARILPVARSSRPRPDHGAHPPDGFGTRWDTGYEAGDEISQFYDNLVGKLIVWGRTRRSPSTAPPSTRRAACRGVATTIPADIAILEHDDFRNNEHSTNGSKKSSISSRCPHQRRTS